MRAEGARAGRVGRGRAEGAGEPRRARAHRHAADRRHADLRRRAPGTPPTRSPRGAGCARASRSRARPARPTAWSRPTSASAITCEATAAGLTAATSAPLEPAAPRGRPRAADRGRPPDRHDALPARPASGTARTRSPTAGCATASPAGTAATLAVGKADVGAEFVCEVTAEGLTVAASATDDGRPARRCSRRRRSPARRSCAGRSSARAALWDDTAAARYAVSYRWFKDDVAIAGATAPRLGPLGPRRPRRRLRLRGHRRGPDARSAPRPVEVLRAVDRRRVPVDRRPGVRRPRDHLRPRRLERQRGAAATPYTYRWERQASRAPGRRSPAPTATTYVVQSIDVDRELRCVVTAEGDWTGRELRHLRRLAGGRVDADRARRLGHPRRRERLPAHAAQPEPDQRLPAVRLASTCPTGFTYKPGSTTGSIDRRPGDLERQLPALAQRAVDRGQRRR